MKDAFLLYESEITDSKTQVRSLTAIVGSLLNCKNFTEEDYEALITKAAQYANRLLKKPDQSRMITLCSHLFSPPAPAPAGDLNANATSYSDPDRVLECLQRALKVASVSNPNIFVEILDRYVRIRTIFLCTIFL
jgi:vacuolar protein sorting-associated protein 35